LASAGRVALDESLRLGKHLTVVTCDLVGKQSTSSHRAPLPERSTRRTVWQSRRVQVQLRRDWAQYTRGTVDRGGPRAQAANALSGRGPRGIGLGPRNYPRESFPGRRCARGHTRRSISKCRRPRRSRKPGGCGRAATRVRGPQRAVRASSHVASKTDTQASLPRGPPSTYISLAPRRSRPLSFSPVGHPRPQPGPQLRPFRPRHISRARR
jgi:hypothetical protein